jgi:tight adherence protein B
MLFVLSFVIFSMAMFGVAYYVWVVPQQEAARQFEARLKTVRTNVGAGRPRGASDLIHRERRGSFAFLGDFISWLGVVNRLQVFIRQANLTWRAADIVGICIAITVLSYVVLDFIIPIFVLRLLLAVILGVIPIVVIMRKRSKRLTKFELQLPDAIDLFTRTMRAGHNIHSGLETISEETTDPVRMEFRKVTEELALGSAIEPALHKLGERVPIIDLKFFVNMVNVLEDLATLVRERLNMAGKMRAHTASQRFSAGLLCILPFVVGLGFYVLKPEYVRLLWTDPLGTKFLTYAIISEIVGIFIIRQISNVKV